MHLFTSCFIGIPLPEQFVSEYQQLQQEIKQLLPAVDLANPKIPHLTLYYLGSQIIENFDEILHRAYLHRELLQGEAVRCSEIDYFRHHDPRVIFLQVEHSPSVEQFYRVMCEELSSFRNEQDTRDFHAHITLGRLRDDSAQQDFIGQKDQILKLGEKVEWSFGIEQIALFGVDDEKKENGQDVLKVIKLR